MCWPWSTDWILPGDIPTPDLHLLALLSKHQASRLHVIPVARTLHGIRVHISDPLDRDAIDVLRHVFREDIDPVVTPRGMIDLAIEQSYKDEG